MATLKGNRGGGVAIYSKESMAIEIEEFPVKNIEGMMCKICNGRYRLILIYIPSMYATAPFIKNLVCLVHHVSNLKDVEGTIFMGDFNENVLTAKGCYQSVNGSPWIKTTGICGNHRSRYFIRPYIHPRQCPWRIFSHAHLLQFSRCSYLQTYTVIGG